MSWYVLTIPAKQDLTEINRYIIPYNLDADRRLNEKIKQQYKLLADFPNMGQSSDNFASGLRSFLVEDYLIFYFANESSGRVNF
ncbi:type II toxin-antitoxin system RelE/ParE family toxin [Nostoc sp. NMS8]|uniref:type II toxin-antitoxin system RelE/ParE family toxin n=1 Tax=Nostoc sp. NMS8 TaxID=2815392 RepID=UPI0025F69426|nr:type II toxin-antitoxin system RelE/ParE family toxin [Nostoc sp. NMS8]MBN3960800.1 type II toxin-antitoxin system RelE/ParE family toxin [Nostoc sp. NMS8]